MRAAALSAGLRTIQFAFVPSNYYDESLEWRRALLGANSVQQLCKTVVVENRKWKAAQALPPALAPADAAAVSAHCSDISAPRPAPPTCFLLGR